MNFNRLQMWSYKVVLALSVVTMFFLATGANNLFAQRPQVPLLSLTGADGKWDARWYPDGRIWLPASSGQPREFLLPVFINNRWHNYSEAPQFVVQPTLSFQFSLKYDSTAVRAVGVQVLHPDNPDFRRTHGVDEYEPLAKNFNITWDDFKDPTYKLYLNPLAQEQDRRKGRQIKIVGTSSTPLPVTTDEDFQVLLYVRFRVEANVNSALGTAGNTPIYVSNDTIKYNDLNISTTPPFVEMRSYNSQVTDLYPDPTPTTGLAGVDNSQIPGRWNIEPYLPGVIYLRLTGVLPAFDFRVQRGTGQQPPMAQIGEDTWDLLDPLTVDENAVGSINYGYRTVQVINKTTTSRMLDVEVETDQPWLFVRAVSIGRSQLPFGLTRKGYIKWIDNGILADEAIRTPTDEFSEDDGDVYLEFRADPTLLESSPEERTGVHVGYVTFKSPTADVSPVKVRVTFIYFKNPIEQGQSGTEAGIHLNVRSVSNPDQAHSARLVFGTGPRATVGVDSLYGEFAWQSDISGFGARFYPPSDAPDSIKNLVKYGFGDFNQNDELPRTGSRDIRNSEDTLQSLTYLVKIKTNAVEEYPIIIQWDTTEFPAGSQLYLRDAVNGLLFNINMRTEGTASGPTTRTYTIQDPTITSFLIEYTPGRVVQYVDQFGQPIIKKGWNFLSLPVKPLNNFWKNVYPNSVAIPLYFTQSQYQPETNLRVGVGYFIKYLDSTNIDTRFAGSFIREISVAAGNPVRIYPGWNTIGACSGTTNVGNIDFDPFNGQMPTKSFVLTAGIWAYQTDRGYYEVSEFRPGLGYWMKSDNNGFLKLRADNLPRAISFADAKDGIIAASSKITVRDNSQRETSLYLTANKNVDLSAFELPPYPPANSFDVRFRNGGMLDNSKMSVINLQAVNYPVAMTMTNADANYTFMDGLTGEILGTVNKGETKSVEIKHERSNSVLVERTDVAIAGLGVTNYPNPVTTASNINFSVPEDGNVTVKLYDAVGNEVRTLANGFYKANELNTVALDAASLTSGNYICRIACGSYTAVTTITVVK